MFSTTRTVDREQLFKWVGPIAVNRVILIAAKERNLKINSVAELENYGIGVVADDVAEQFLLNAGVPKENLESVSSTTTNILKLTPGRIDLWAYGENVTAWQIKSQGLDPDDYITVFVLNEKELHYAFHNENEDSLIRNFRLPSIPLNPRAFTRLSWIGI